MDRSPQHQLFEDAGTRPTVLGVLDDIVTALGGNKKVGKLLREELPVENAAQWVRDCLNPRRRERFDPDQLIKLLLAAKKAGFHAGKHFIDAQTGYLPSTPLEPEDKRAELQQRFVSAVDRLHELADEMRREGVPLPARGSR